MSLDPQFVNASSGDYHLLNLSTKKSPCINAGDPNAKNLPKTDLDGANRVVGVVDIGAYEVK